MADTFTPPPLSSHEGLSDSFVPPPVSSEEKPSFNEREAASAQADYPKTFGEAVSDFVRSPHGLIRTGLRQIGEGAHELFTPGQRQRGATDVLQGGARTLAPVGIGATIPAAVAAPGATALALGGGAVGTGLGAPIGRGIVSLAGGGEDAQDLGETVGGGAGGVLGGLTAEFLHPSSLWPALARALSPEHPLLRSAIENAPYLGKVVKDPGVQEYLHPTVRSVPNAGLPPQLPVPAPVPLGPDLTRSQPGRLFVIPGRAEEPLPIQRSVANAGLPARLATASRPEPVEAPTGRSVLNANLPARLPVPRATSAPPEPAAPSSPIPKAQVQTEPSSPIPNPAHEPISTARLAQNIGDVAPGVHGGVEGTPIPKAGLHLGETKGVHYPERYDEGSGPTVRSTKPQTKVLKEPAAGSPLEQNPKALAAAKALAKQVKKK